MHPEFITIGSLTIHMYGLMIMLGAITGYIYMSRVSKRELGIEPEKIQNLAVIIIVAAFVGGKLLFYLEKPSYYFSSWDHITSNFRTGFVFYGSLLFALPAIVWYFRKQKFPVWPMLDRIAITGAIIHAFGRMGCFFAGCCYGQPTDSIFAITFTDPMSKARPMHTALHPTQLYEVFYILIVLVTLLMLKRYKRLEGRLIFVYVTLYAVGRSIIEIFRGDIARGFIIDGWLSHSQFISILIVIAAGVAYYFGYKKKA
jgi:phosphatidylglycerol---prolipoprotein diacylglyceryl transferase